ncbi:MAG: Zn-ribbon domain-containing OB-fold protein [Calditrichaeota bacterium]|nr:Zn-ribbon domain-containing OB-fold protein [Calditrichota bacterium]MCB0304254.1 Zn-ribbon domain-containing OB-fold protein [Calditrichota bacterium]MCB9089812.1 Zn-ribbon domain-containing OB-fold protein [Calditrichia bacterium]
MDIPRSWRLRNQRYLLEGTRCSHCDQKHFPPVLICPACQSRETAPFAFSGQGKLYSYSVVYQAPSQFEAFVPYIVALVDLEEGPRITAQLTDVSPEEVQIGMPLEKVIRKISEEGERGLIFYGYKFRPLVTY